MKKHESVCYQPDYIHFSYTVFWIRTQIFVYVSRIKWKK